MNNHKFIIRFAQASEYDRVAELIAELQDYQKLETVKRIPNGQELKEEVLANPDTEDGKEIQNRGTYIAIAIDALTNQIVGYIIYYHSFSLVDGFRMFISSLFIIETYRRCGIGNMFMKFMKDHLATYQTDATRVDVSVMKNNDSGIKFYNKYNAQIVDDEYLLHIKICKF